MSSRSARVNRPVSTRVGRKRTKTESSASASPTNGTQNPSKQKQVVQREKLRQDYMKELNTLEQQYSTYQQKQIAALIQKQKCIREQLQISESLQEGLVLQCQHEELERQIEVLRAKHDIAMIHQLKTLMDVKTNEEDVCIKKKIKTENEEASLSAPPSSASSFLQPFLDRFHKAPVHLFFTDQNVIESRFDETIFCPFDQTRLVDPVDDGSLSCPDCGYTTTCIDISVEAPPLEENVASRDALMDKVLKLFDPPDHTFSELEKCKSGGSKDLINFQKAVQHCKDVRERKRLRGIGYDKVTATDIDLWLKQSKDKEVSVRFGHCHLEIASVLNGEQMPYRTPEETLKIQRLRLLVREALQMLRPPGTMFHAIFAFIRFCQILAIKFHKNFQRFIPWVPKLTHKGRLHRQEQFWFSVCMYTGLPVLSGQDMLSDETICIQRKQHKITTAEDGLSLG